MTRKFALEPSRAGASAPPVGNVVPDETYDDEKGGPP